jgi:LacI family transcriptional regulator
MATIKDVAKLAGVGIGTVSRVINNSGSVKDTTRKKVEKAIKELNFIPSDIARSFKSGKSNIVALLLPSVFHSFFSEIAYYCEMELDQRGYKMMLCNSNGSADKELYYFDLVSQSKVAGIIALTYNDIDKHVDDRLPIVSIDRHFTNDVNCVTSDNYNGGRIAAENLHQKNHDVYAYVGTYNNKIDSEVKFRKQGFIDFCESNNLKYVEHTEEDPIIDIGIFLTAFFDKHKDNSIGAFVENDVLAAYFINRARDFGYYVRDNLSVIGFDGIQALDFFVPKIATIRQQVPLLSKVSVENVVNQIEGRETKKREVVPIKYLEGESI